MSSLIKRKLKSATNYVLVFLKWVLIAGLTGLVGGIVGYLFGTSVFYANQWFDSMWWLVFLLPLGGLFIAFLYKASNIEEDPGTNRVIDSIRTQKYVPAIMSPLIFVSTFVTHLFGGSSGREGAALQLGGSIGTQVGRFLKLDEKDMHLSILCGMSGVFSALFGTPVAATFFALEVISVGVTYYSALVPCFMSAITAYGIATFFGYAPTRYNISKIIPQLNIITLLQVTGLAVLCAVVSIAFCVAIHKTAKYAKKWLPNTYLRTAAGGCIIIALTLLVQNTDYNGAGVDIILKAVNGVARPEAFVLKIIFTAVTIGCGFKGGEIVPTLFIGATFGCAAGSLIGLPGGFGAAIGLIALFCGVINCPVAALVLGIELFGSQGIIFFTLACVVSYMLSGYYGLYSSQKIMYSKLKAEFININAK